MKGSRWMTNKLLLAFIALLIAALVFIIYAVGRYAQPKKW